MKIIFFISATLFILWLIWKLSRMERKDWKEYIPYYKRIIDQAGEEAFQILEEKKINRSYGYCHRFWGLKKRILKEKYNINWKTPAELNRHIIFD
ncbi:MAG: hypothetical protein RLZZ94_1216 [Bacteroidota bacterium]